MHRSIHTVPARISFVGTAARCCSPRSLVFAVMFFYCLLGPRISSVRAQANDPLAAIGVPPFVSQVPVENGSISTANGDLHLEFPLGSFSQRGLPPVQLALRYDSMWVETLGFQYPGWRFVNSQVPSNFGDLGWGGTYDWIPPHTCSRDGQGEVSIYKNFTFTDPYGTVHAFTITTQQGNLTACADFRTESKPSGDAFAKDLSGYHMFVTNFYFMTVYGPDGTQVAPQWNGSTYSAGPDTNGNTLSWSTSSCQDFPGIFYHVCNLTDTVGRSLFSASLNGNTLTFNVLNSQGGTSTYTATLETVNFSTNFGYPAGDTSGSFQTIKSISLPDGTSYQFGYDSGTTPGYYGQLTSMTLPTGAQVSYSYSNFFDSEYVPAGGGAHHVTRVVSQRTTPDGTWTFTPAVILQCGNGVYTGCKQQLTVAKPAYNGRSDNVVYKTIIYIGGFNSGAFPYEVDYYNGAVSPSNLLLTELQTWNSYQLLASTITLPVPGGTINQTTQQCYDDGTNRLTTTANILSKWEWNFYTGAILPDPTVGSNGCALTATTPADRTTSISYLNGSSYLAKNIVNRPSNVTVTNASGATVAQTLYCYDDNSNGGGCGTPNISGNPANIMNHDDTNFGSGNPYRGNPTQVKRLISGSNYAITSTTYDVTGQRITTTDPNGNQTSFAYGDNFFNDSGDGQNPPNTYSPPKSTNAYLTNITHPTVNSVTLTENFGYYWGTGQKALSSDANTQKTYFHFYDSLNRPTSTKLPNTYNSSCCGWTKTVYPTNSETQLDTAIGITSTTPSISCSGLLGDCRHDQTLTDGLGRTTSKILVSDPDGATTVNSAYDTNGRVLKVTNPYRSSQTVYWETYAYDGLDRKIQVTRTDGSGAYTSYGTLVNANGNGGRSSQMCSGIGYPVLTKDEAGRLRQTWTDGFGRLIEVDEPDPSTGSLTSGSYAATCYRYDLNNNLTSVVQGSETRNFSYDMLSRLLMVTNPESGTTNYYYTTLGGTLCSGDPSAVCRKTDARNITTTFSYDALDRLVAKSYSDSTPGVQYGYDAVAPNGCTPPSLNITFGKDRRTGMCDGSGQSAWSFDQFGNPQIEKRVTNGVTNAITYGYNLDASEATVQYPSGRTITYQPGGAQRPLSEKDVTNSISYAVGPASPNYIVSYAPQGAIQSLQDGSSLVSTLYYNNRLQPCRISIKNGGTAPTSCTDATNIGNVLDFTYGFNAGTTDNGNVIRIANNIAGSAGRSVNYAYDWLNRIASAYTDATSGTGCWSETYSIDRYGNLMAINGKSGYSGCTQESGLSVTLNSSNQVTGPGTFTYDAAGNLTGEPSPSCLTSVTYDAEDHVTSACGVTYYYDGDGKRVRKSGGILYWYGTGSDPLVETDGNGNLPNEYIFFGGKRIARRDSSGNVEYYVVDHLGSSRVVTNASGAVLESCDYYPYGASNCSPSSINNYLFTAKERDSESGLDNFGARYYSSQYGRFMSPDPVGGKRDDPQSLNKYSYVRNNPLSRTDPTGLYDCMDGQMQCETKNDKNFADALLLLSRSGLEGAAEAYAYGKAGDGNGISIDFKSADGMGGAGVAGNTSWTATVHIPPPGSSKVAWVGNIHIESDFLAGLKGKDLLQTVAHEGSHVLDDLGFVHSFDFSTGKFNSAFNFTKYETEFKAFETGAKIKSYQNLNCSGGGGSTPCGTIDSSPKGLANLDRYLTTNPHYSGNSTELEFPRAWPQ
jgi:RHS repeat-associated protein